MCIAVRTPTYEDIASLGQSNSQWTVEEISRIAADDLISSLAILGSVTGWSVDQRKTLVESYEKVQ